ncbi:MAG: hypothetical protein C0616_04145 [Desulfuromonas sp.]|nr:MAG: hypothetical protein C0616_04145 [Desulfuromonas sp.]
MRRIGILCLLLLLLTGCQKGIFYVEPEVYETQVRTLGIVPILVDPAVPIGHDEGERVVQALLAAGKGVAPLLAEKLRSEKEYFDVRAIEAEPRQLAARLLLPGTSQGGTRGYQLDAAVVRQLAEENVVDGLLLIVLRGEKRAEKRFDRNSFLFLEAVYQRIEAEAIVVLPDGRLVWEFPAEESYKLLDLEYPDFDEAHFNRTDEVRIHQITLAGIERALAPRQGEGTAALSEPYGDLLWKLIHELRRNKLRFW